MPTQPPPDVPTGLGTTEAAYLRRLAAWAYQEIDNKIGKTDPVQQVMLYPITQKTPQAVFGIVVNENGIIATQPVPFAGGNPGAALYFAPTTGYGESSVANPTGTTSAAYVMMGCNLILAGEVATAVWVTVDGQITNSSNNGKTDCVIVYGTGTAPANGAPLTGTIEGQPASYVATAANDYVPFSLTALIADISTEMMGGGIWLDLALKATGGTAKVMDLNFSAHGLA